jgi:ABC-2 type transport system permease protein
LNKTFWVALREFRATVFTKAFLLAVGLPPVLMGIAFTLMPLLMNKAAPRVEGHIALIDRSGLVASRLEKAFEPGEVAKRREEAIRRGMEKAPLPPELKEQAMTQAKVSVPAGPELHLKTLKADATVEDEKAPIRAAKGLEKDAHGADPRLALIVIPEAAVKAEKDQPLAKFELFVAPKLDFEVQDDIEHQVGRAIVDARIAVNGMDVEKVRSLIKTPESVTKAVTTEGEKSNSEVAKILVPGAFMFLLWISVFTAGQYLLTTTIEEKSSRVMEVLLSAVSPMQLLSGKIIGQMAVGVVILVAYSGMGMLGLVAASMMHIVDPANLVYLAVYFVIAFALIACLMAAVGSAVSDIREAQSLMGPVMIVLIIPMMLWFPILRNPNSTFATVCSFIPPISPFVMVLRLSGSEKIPAWEVPASMAVGFASVFVFAWAAAKIFRIGVLMYGKPPNFPTLIRWIRMA